MKTYFKASSWDPLLQFITGAVLLFAVGFIYYNPGPVTIIVCGAFILIPPIFMIRGYSIIDQQLVIHRLGWTKTFDIHDLISAETNSRALVGYWRLFGNGGLFGWIGTFSNKELGTFRAYVTHRRKCVVLVLPNRKLVISPENPGNFVSAVRSSSDQ